MKGGWSWGFFSDRARRSERGSIPVGLACGRSGEVRERRRAIEDLLALRFVQAAPDSVRLADSEGVLEAVVPDAARPADGLGSTFTPESFLFSLYVRGWEEHDRVGPSTCGSRLPQLFASVGNHPAS